MPQQVGDEAPPCDGRFGGEGHQRKEDQPEPPANAQHGRVRLEPGRNNEYREETHSAWMLKRSRMGSMLCTNYPARQLPFVWFRAYGTHKFSGDGHHRGRHTDEDRTDDRVQELLVCVLRRQLLLSRIALSGIV